MMTSFVDEHHLVRAWVCAFSHETSLSVSACSSAFSEDADNVVGKHRLVYLHAIVQATGEDSNEEEKLHPEKQACFVYSWSGKQIMIVSLQRVFRFNNPVLVCRSSYAEGSIITVIITAIA